MSSPSSLINGISQLNLYLQLVFGQSWPNLMPLLTTDNPCNSQRNGFIYIFFSMNMEVFYFYISFTIEETLGTCITQTEHYSSHSWMSFPLPIRPFLFTISSCFSKEFIIPFMFDTCMRLHLWMSFFPYNLGWLHCKTPEKCYSDIGCYSSTRQIHRWVWIFTSLSS